MTTRREFVTVLGGAAAWPIGARAQQTARHYRIGILETVPASLNSANINGLYKGLRERGYVEGHNLTIIYRSADGHAERFPDLATELVSHNVEVIVTRGTPAALAAKDALGNVPVVMAAIGEPLETGVVLELARPGSKVTGLSAFVNELAAKRVELLHDLIPGIKRFGFLHNMRNPVAPPQWRETQKAAEGRQLQVKLLDIKGENDIVEALGQAKKERIEAVIVAFDGLVQVNETLIRKLAQINRLPIISQSREFVENGGLMSLGVNYPALYHRAAAYVDKVLKGVKPAELPVEQPTKIELVINLNAARALGLEIPPTLLARADEVIE